MTFAFPNLDHMFRFVDPDPKTGRLVKLNNDVHDVQRFVKLNARMYEGEFEERMENRLEHSQLWVSIWEKNDLKVLCEFCMSLAKQEKQCVGVLNLLVWASFFHSPQEFLAILNQENFPFIFQEKTKSSKAKQYELQKQSYLRAFVQSEAGTQPSPKFSLIEFGLYDKISQNDSKHSNVRSTGSARLLDYCSSIGVPSSLPICRYLESYLGTPGFCAMRKNFLKMVAHFEAQ